MNAMSAMRRKHPEATGKLITSSVAPKGRNESQHSLQICQTPNFFEGMMREKMESSVRCLNQLRSFQF